MANGVNIPTHRDLMIQVTAQRSLTAAIQWNRKMLCIGKVGGRYELNYV